MQQRILTLAAAVLAALAPASSQNLTDPSAAAKLAKSAALENSRAQQVIVGRPFSATEDRRSLQVLADGTHIENHQTNRIYRDADGRTRMEVPDGNVTLVDPVAGITAILNASATRILKKGPLPPLLADQQAADLKKADLLNSKTGPSRTEILAPQMLGGVIANGTRTTTTIPAGALGNDRPINVVTERWYSDELQIMVKSTNSDPRFGDTTYEVTGIIQGPPDPALFQIPADYVNTTDPRVLDKLRAADEAKRKAAEQSQQSPLVKKPLPPK